jgi:HSP20 family protein
MPFWRKKENGDRISGERTEDWEPEDIFDDPFLDMQIDLFHDFDYQFRRMRTYMDAIMENAVSGELQNTGEGGPFVYGWSLRVGPDGVPHVQTFGNEKRQGLRGARALPAGEECARRTVKDRPRAGLLGRDERSSSTEAQGARDDDGTEGSCNAEAMTMPNVREPLTDICEYDSKITITAEMPGIGKDDIELETGDDFLVIKVETGSRRFYKELPLDTRIVPGSARAKYNGVLEITVGKVPADKKSTRVKVE